MRLTSHFTLYELTVTSRPELQELNRQLTPEQIRKLGTLALFAEDIRAVCGDKPMRIHSGYRTWTLNGQTPGSSRTSQHPLCEAIDFDAPDLSIEETFGTLLMAARTGDFSFGQLILERAQRPYGAASWIHASVRGSLPPEKVGQVLRMNSGADGVPAYQEICRIRL